VQVDTRNTSQWDLSLTGFRPEDILLVSGTDRADLDKVSDEYECRLCLGPQLVRNNNTFFKYAFLGIGSIPTPLSAYTFVTF
jgi:hypothetical protein